MLTRQVAKEGQEKEIEGIRPHDVIYFFLKIKSDTEEKQRMKYGKCVKDSSGSGTRR